MPVRRAQAEWNGDLPTGRGTIRTETGAVDGQLAATEITLDAVLEG